MNTPGKGKIYLFLLTGLIIGLSLGAAIFFGGGVSRQGREDRPFPQVGKQFPNFKLETLDGNTISFERLTQQPVILNFWATWCEPCKEEMPLLQAYEVKYPEIVVIGINYDEPLQTVRRFVENNDVAFQILLDPGGKISNQFKVFGFPTTFFIDANGVLQANHIGQLNEQLMDLYLEKIGIIP
jgi:cytochrome c biogenesis protein CcmG, thiol:disulfide interchange protein DsbE